MKKSVVVLLSFAFLAMCVAAFWIGKHKAAVRQGDQATVEKVEVALAATAEAHAEVVAAADERG